jgi:acetyl-CoA carboxylase carboxyl transferase subunit alpha
VNVTGEGGSGGALAIAVGDRVNMLEHAIYSVISPEGCASILWRDAGRGLGGRGGHEDHRHRPQGLRHRGRDRPRAPPAAPTRIRKSLFRCLTRSSTRSCASCPPCPAAELVDARYRKFRELGALGREFTEVPPAPGPRP